MNVSEFDALVPDHQAPPKPRLAIMGEFSSGKSTLSNLLIGASPLPVKVTATQLPPVWMAFGDEEPYREDLEGIRHPVELDRLEDIPLHETAIIRIFLQAEILEMCDLIDMPGISDPNMPPEIWERVIPQADAVLWCTHATQAWRQSEAAVWKSLTPELFENSILLITRIDKLLTDRDQNKVVKRVMRETEGLFGQTFPISLTQAVAADGDITRWEQSGAGAFSQGLYDLVQRLSSEMGGVEHSEIIFAGQPNSNEEPSKVVKFEDAVPDAMNNEIDVAPSRVNISVTPKRVSVRPSRPNTA